MGLKISISLILLICLPADGQCFCFQEAGTHYVQIWFCKTRLPPISVLFPHWKTSALFEGMPLGNQLAGGDIATSHHHEDDFSLLLGIVFHRIPVAIALMTLLSQRELKPVVSWMVLLAFAVISPIGMVIGYYGHNSMEGFDLDIILAIVVGMFLHISTTIIFETSENHKFNFMKLLSILFGFGLAYLLH